MREALETFCRKRGFSRFGVTPAGPSPRAEFLSEWLERGYQGEMAWLARAPEIRQDIRKRYPWAKSVLLLAAEYRADEPKKLPSESVLRQIARYARGLDYHDTLKPALKDIQDEVIRLGGPGTQALWYQDTGPFLERDLAAAAGLGWVGKNTLLIDTVFGSYSFLALIVTSLELAPDAPVADHCGHCTACLDACPTNAFPAPGVLDARRCISYLTIEHKGAIEPELRPGMGSWLFGCDICQEVCPWNRKAGERPGEPPKLPAREPPKELAELTLSKLLLSKDEHLMARLQGTPLQRTGAARLKRNAAIVAGNRRDQKLLSALEQTGRHAEPVVREAVYDALSRFGTREARAVLARAQRHETDDDLRETLIRLLQQGTGGVAGDSV